MKLTKLNPETIIASANGRYGAPRSFFIADSGRRVIFLRSSNFDNPLHDLWMLQKGEKGIWSEQCLAKTEAVNTGSNSSKHTNDLRERLREQAAGITSYTSDANADRLAFELGGRIWLCDITHSEDLSVAVETGSSPLMSPDGSKLAYVGEAGVQVLNIAKNRLVSLEAQIAPNSETDLVGLPDFISAEEIGRMSGMWWSPDSSKLLVQVSETAIIPEAFITDPGNPQKTPRSVRYPFAGGPNVQISLILLDCDTGLKTMIKWDTGQYPYLREVVWTKNGGLTWDVQTRDQKHVITYSYDLAEHALVVIAEISDSVWVEVGNGTCAHSPQGTLCQIVDVDNTRQLRIGQNLADSPADLLLMSCLGATQAGLVVQYGTPAHGRVIYLIRWDGRAIELSASRGSSAGYAKGALVIIHHSDLSSEQASIQIHELDEGRSADSYRLNSNAIKFEWSEKISFFKNTEKAWSSVLLMPSWYDHGRHGKLPVIVDSYGGPQISRITQSRYGYLTSRWFAEQGFAVIVTDGIGSAGQSVESEKRLRGDFTQTLDSQLRALKHLLEQHSRQLDAKRVGIRGWSFGGYLAALAAISEPGIFSAAVVGAPVTDWLLYDTHYTERYLGLGSELEKNALRSSLTERLVTAQEAHEPPAPMLIMHGYNDDNVLVANSVQLTNELIRYGFEHRAYFLSSSTHMPSKDVGARLIEMELTFFREKLGVTIDTATAH